MDARDRILGSAFGLFGEAGYEATSVAEICRRAKVSNGSFFHAFSTKEVLGADLFMSALEDYHAAMTLPLRTRPTARDGIGRLVRAHLDWVVLSEPRARYLFEQSRPEWLVHVRDRQASENDRFGRTISEWRQPLVASGALLDLPPGVFTAQLIGPAQIFCRAWLSGRSKTDPREHAKNLIACARRALLA
jgi:AcrR family transcriptional regulator